MIGIRTYFTGQERRALLMLIDDLELGKFDKLAIQEVRAKLAGRKYEHWDYRVWRKIPKEVKENGV